MSTTRVPGAMTCQRCVCVCEVVWERVTVQRDTTWEQCSWISVKQWEVR